MSLINDALKRASQAPPPLPGGGPGAAPLRPVPEPPAPLWTRLWLPATLAVILSLAGLFMYKGWRASRETQRALAALPVAARETPDSKPDQPAPTPAPRAAQTPAQVASLPPTAVPAPSSLPGARVPPSVSQGGLGVSPKTPAKLAPETAPATPVLVPAQAAPGALGVPPRSPPPPSPGASHALAPRPTAPPSVTFPALKLQGIFYRSNNPSAMINSKTVFRGDTLEGVRVVTITRSSVTLEFAGQTKVLTLP